MTFDLILRGKKCAYCGAKTSFIDSAEVYNGVSYGVIYACLPCEAWVGVHKGSTAALGRVAKAELRVLKMGAHQAFDGLWRKKQNGLLAAGGTKDSPEFKACRSDAYAWLSAAMGTEPDKTHIGFFDEAQCLKVIELCNPYLR